MKKRVLAFLMSMAFVLALLPAQALAFTNNHSSAGYPNIYPQSAHPRVMFTSSDIPTISANLSNAQNTAAYTHWRSLVDDSSFKTTTIIRSSFRNDGDYSGRYFDNTIENKLEALAFDYAINGTTSSADAAITRGLEYLQIVQNYTSSNSLAYRYYGAALFHAAEIFDWCYNYSGFTTDKKTTWTGYCDNILKKLDVYSSNSVDAQGAITGHGAENQILRDVLAYGIATYGFVNSSSNSRSDIYNMAMGRIQHEFVPVRNYLYQSGTTHQGSEYGWYRFYWDLYAEVLVERMRQSSKVTLFDRDAMHDVYYSEIFSRRPDGRFFTEGDNKQSQWWYYNKFNLPTAKMAADLFDDPFFKGEYRMMQASEDFSGSSNFTDFRSFNSVQWLIMNNPSVEFTDGNYRKSNLEKSRYFGSPIGKIYARTNWGFSRTGYVSMGITAVEMKIGEQFSANHDHLDAGTFQIWRGGLLTGDYNAQDDYGLSFDNNYYRRTVAHNAITIYRSGESWGTTIDNGASSNDGGQLSSYETNNFATWQNNIPFKRATVVNHFVADDNSYSYIKGDITRAYATNKAELVVRSMAFLTSWPPTMVVFDKVTSDSSSYKKRFLLHTASEPTVTGNNKVVYDNTQTLTYSAGSATNGGRLTVNTLLPTSATITKVAGKKATPNGESGSTYTPSDRTTSPYEPEWGRVEIQAATEGTTTHFLNVLTTTDSGNAPTDATIIGNESSSLVGAKLGGSRVVMFANTGAGSLTSATTFTVSGEDTGLKFFIFGLDEGGWTVVKDGAVKIGTFDATAEGGTIAFTGDAGTYQIKPYDSGDTQFDVVAWYDYRKTDGSTSNSGVTTWTDLSLRGNDWDIPILADKTFWNGSGSSFALRIIGDGSNITSLPDEVKDTINSGQFTLEFAVSSINAGRGELMTLFGNPRGDFAVYKIMNANKIYMKTPGTKTFINRPYWQLWNDEFTEGYGVNNHHCIITVDTTANGGDGEMKWYLDGNLVASSDYSDANSVSVINLVSESGQRVDYKQIKVIDRAITAGEAKGEYKAYRDGTF